MHLWRGCTLAEGSPLCYNKAIETDEGGLEL